MPAFHRHRVKERKRERENKREEENTGPICYGWYEDGWKGGYNGRTEGGKGGKGGVVDCGERGEGKGMFGLVGCQEGVKYQSVIVLCQSTMGPLWPVTHLYLMSLAIFTCMFPHIKIKQMTTLMMVCFVYQWHNKILFGCLKYKQTVVCNTHRQDTDKYGKLSQYSIPIHSIMFGHNDQQCSLGMYACMYVICQRSTVLYDITLTYRIRVRFKFVFTWLHLLDEATCVASSHCLNAPAHSNEWEGLHFFMLKFNANAKMSLIAALGMTIEQPLWDCRLMQIIYHTHLWFYFCPNYPSIQTTVSIFDFREHSLLVTELTLVVPC